MQCPVCCGRAKNLTPNTLDGVVVGCAHCGDYRIAGGAFHDLLQLQLHERAAALEAAKVQCRVGWPMISTNCIRAR